MWQRLYEEDEGWQEATEAEARYSLSKAYHSLDALMAELKDDDGRSVPTGFARVRWVAEPDPCDGCAACVKDPDIDCP